MAALAFFGRAVLLLWRRPYSCFGGTIFVALLWRYRLNIVQRFVGFACSGSSGVAEDVTNCVSNGGCHGGHKGSLILTEQGAVRAVHGGSPSATTGGSAGESDSDSFGSCLRTNYPKTRYGLPALLNCLKLVGKAVEVGVQRGLHAKEFLRNWKGEHLLLVDKWETVASEEYVDIANVGGERMKDIKAICASNVEEFGKRVGGPSALRMWKNSGSGVTMQPAWSADAAKTVPDDSLDFVYLDARHDFNGVFEDLSVWWPKLKMGGILAGHDYCDGERPEGDFFVQTAVNWGGNDHGRCCTCSKQLVISCSRISNCLEVNAFLNIKAGTCPPKNFIFRTFERDRGDTFIPKCKTLCGFDCERRLRDLWPEAYKAKSRAAKDEDPSAPPPTLPDSFQSYSVECPRRCEMTCEQKKVLFEKISGREVAGEVFRVYPPGEEEQGLVEGERQFRSDPENFLLAQATGNESKNDQRFMGAGGNGRSGVNGSGKTASCHTANDLPFELPLDSATCAVGRASFAWGEPEEGEPEEG